MKFKNLTLIRKIIILILSFLLFNIAFTKQYIPVDEDEKRVLEKFRNKNITIGLYTNKFYNQKSTYNNMSINNVIVDLFNDYLGLNVKFKQARLSDLLKSVEDNKIQGISLINEQNKRASTFLFSEEIYNESVSVVSFKKKLRSISDLEGEKIYVASKDIYIEFLETALFNNNINAEIIEVDDLNKYRTGFILTSSPILYDPVSILKVTNSSNTVIGVNKQLNELLPILNNALRIKYKELINKQISYIKEDLALENFYSSLSEEEKKYLKNLKTINIIYNKEFSSELYYFSKIENKLKGIIPNISKIISRALDIKLNEIYEDRVLEENSSKIFILSKTKNRSKKLIFTNTVYELPAYMITLKTTKIDEKFKVGVIKNSIEKEIVEKYYLTKNLKVYQSYTSLIEGLNSREVHSILTKNTELVKNNKYNISIFEKVPLSFAFKKEDYLLKNIMEKAITKLVYTDIIINNSILEKSNEEALLLNNANHKKRSFLLLSLSLFLLLLFSCVKIIMDKRYKTKLLKDPLSQLPNRFVFNEFCNKKSSNLKGYTLIIDFDNFKEINDIYGHEIGDLIIIEFSSYLSNNFNSKTIFRISGDEFYGVIDKEINDIINILKNYKEYCPILKKYNATFSLGIYRKNLNSHIKNDFKYADMAMFEAKKTKGFSYKIADIEFIKKKKREEKILEILNGDLSEIYPVFQPKIDLNTNIVIGAEALARCLSRDFGMIYPLEFIGVAETYNIVHRIDYKIAEESIRVLKEKHVNNEFDNNFKISFNLSVNTFKRDDLIETIENLLIKYNISGKYLEVEITESVFISDMKDIIDKLNRLKELGIQLSLDDFTAGHSTAGILPFLPLSIVKLDKSLLDSFNKNKERGKIVYLNMVTLVKDLDLKIVAEGIETKEEFEFLKKAGVDYGQGFFIGKPSPYKKMNS